MLARERTTARDASPSRNYFLPQHTTWSEETIRPSKTSSSGETWAGCSTAHRRAPESERLTTIQPLPTNGNVRPRGSPGDAQPRDELGVVHDDDELLGADLPHPRASNRNAPDLDGIKPRHSGRAEDGKDRERQRQRQRQIEELRTSSPRNIARRHGSCTRPDRLVYYPRPLADAFLSHARHHCHRHCRPLPSQPVPRHPRRISSNSWLQRHRQELVRK